MCVYQTDKDVYIVKHKAKSKEQLCLPILKKLH